MERGKTTMHKKSNKGSPKEELNKDAVVADSTSDDSTSSDGDVDKYGKYKSF
jgi:hypothetical protein